MGIVDSTITALILPYPQPNFWVFALSTVLLYMQKSIIKRTWFLESSLNCKWFLISASISSLILF